MMESKKRKAKMTKQEAIHILMHIDTNVEYDEDFGIMVKAPLMDACVLGIKALKTEAVEVKHGEWIMVIDENDCECIECPLCGEQFYDGDNDTFDKPYNYCPNCGADMRGDGNGN